MYVKLMWAVYTYIHHTTPIYTHPKPKPANQNKPKQVLMVSIVDRSLRLNLADPSRLQTLRMWPERWFDVLLVAPIFVLAFMWCVLLVCLWVEGKGWVEGTVYYA